MDVLGARVPSSSAVGMAEAVRRVAEHSDRGAAGVPFYLLNEDPSRAGVLGGVTGGDAVLVCGVDVVLD